MASKHKSLILLLGAVSICSAAGLDYSNNPVAIRMQNLETILKNKNVTEASAFIHKEIENNTPSETNRVDHGESIIALLSILAKAQDHLEYLADTMKNLLTRSDDLVVEFKRNQGLAEYLLDWYSFEQLLETLAYFKPRTEEIEWISYGVVFAIENTSHLKNSFSKGMLYRLNDLRIQANGVHNIHLIRALNITDYIVRFPYKAIIIDSGLSNRNESRLEILEPQMRKTLIEESLQYSIEILLKYSRMRNNFERCTSLTFAALLELSDTDLAHHLEEVAYALEFYQIEKTYEYREESNVIATFDLMLKKKCEGAGLTERLQERLQRFEIARNTMNYDDNNFMRQLQKSPELFMNLESLEQMIIVFRLINKGTRGRLPETIKHHAFYNLENAILEPEIFNIPQRLARYAEVHAKLHETNVFEFKWSPTWMKHPRIIKDLMTYTNRAEELITTLTTEPPQNSLDIRNQIRIVLRFAVQMSNIRKKFLHVVGDQAPIIEKIAKMYIKLMKFGGDILTNESPIMQQWYYFTLLFPEQISKVLNEETIDEIIQYSNAANSNDDADAVLYVFMARIANFLAQHKRSVDTSDLVKRVMELEGKIGSADTAAPFLHKQVLREKQIFYSLFDIHNIDNDLGKLVKHHVELYTSTENWHDIELKISSEMNVNLWSKHQLLDQIFTATINDSDVVDHLNDPNDQLRTQVNQLTNGFIREVNGFKIGDFTRKMNQCETIYGKFE